MTKKQKKICCSTYIRCMKAKIELLKNLYEAYEGAYLALHTYYYGLFGAVPDSRTTMEDSIEKILEDNHGN